MPGRKVVLATGQLYHLFNRGNSYQPVFLNTFNYRRFVKTIDFYRLYPYSIALFQFLKYSRERREKYVESLSVKGKQLVNVFCFSLMPNHYHFLVRQQADNGISKFMSQIQNSYTKYFNIRGKRVGSLFQGHFKAIRIETDEQLIHLSRYIHLNPYSSYVVKSKKDLITYPWSSLPDYLGKEKHPFLEKGPILDLFRDKKDYQEFVFDQADYQRELEKIKHLTWEEYR